ncbi:MAG: hypothetical protein KAZ71_01845 [Bacteroidia bacterium]|jgi:hypothetical protein|nr:hypothetical protein [Bacteroidia bacterium]
MEENILIENNPIDEPKRPQFLSVLCILSIIWSSIIILSLFLCLVFSGTIFSSLEKITSGDNGMPQLDSVQIEGIEKIINLGQGKFVAIIAFAIVIYMTSLLGVIKMWKLQKWGFYIYAGVNTLAIIYDIISGSYFSIIVSAIFIGMYFSNLKHMK